MRNHNHSFVPLNFKEEHMNIEAAVRHALTAYRAEDGTVNQAASAAWAEEHLAEGIEVFSVGLMQMPEPGSMPIDAAFNALKAWATTLL